jgi:hypothetical protein
MTQATTNPLDSWSDDISWIEMLMARKCFQKTLVLVFHCGKIHAECVGVNGGLLKVRETKECNTGYS